MSCNPLVSPPPKNTLPIHPLFPSGGRQRGHHHQHETLKESNRSQAQALVSWIYFSFFPFFLLPSGGFITLKSVSQPPGPAPAPHPDTGPASLVAFNPSTFLFFLHLFLFYNFYFLFNHFSSFLGRNGHWLSAIAGGDYGSAPGRGDALLLLLPHRSSLGQDPRFVSDSFSFILFFFY